MAAWLVRVKQQQQHLSLLFTVSLLVATVFCPYSTQARRVHKRFIIHVPYKIKTHHHTHTVYSIIQSGGHKQTVYKILGYSQHKGHTRKGGYKDDKHMQGCDEHKSGMVFNHYDRNDEDQYYPDVEEMIDDEQGDEWERSRMFFDN